ncbi:MAG: outer membrane lipoprotein carrier protein LolA [Bacteroidales bacterium]|nr:outer membrane lipoprotein carrier protein LolA [Bacteroidales bacterium]
MKKLHLLILVFFLSSSFISAQVELTKDPAAKKILDAVSKKVSQDKGIRIKFTYTTDNRQTDFRDTQKGYVFLKGQQFKVIIPKIEIISNGSTVWTYMKEDKEVTISDTDTSDVSIFNPTKLFTAYKQGFKYLLIGEETINNVKYYVIDLYPEDSQKSPYSIIRIKINKNTKEIYSIKTSGKSGVDYTFKVSEYKTDIKMPQNLFVFDKSKYPSDIEVTDMR